MALELLAVDHAEVKEAEEYQVACRQLSLINDYIKRFLSWSKKDTHSSLAANENSPIKLLPILESTVQLLRPMAKHLNVELSLDDSDDVTANLASDDARQVIVNLVGNAIAAAKEAATEKASPRPRVEVWLKGDDGKVSLIISDNGNGPPAAIADKIFEPFVSGSVSGTGLGLVQVAEIADQLGGRVDWRRDDGRTVFEFRFPGHNQLDRELQAEASP